MSLLKEKNNKFSSDNQAVLYLITAKSYLKENNLNEALNWATTVFSKNPDSEKKIEAFQLLSEINRKLKNYESALAFKDGKIRNDRLIFFSILGIVLLLLLFCLFNLQKPPHQKPTMPAHRTKQSGNQAFKTPERNR